MKVCAVIVTYNAMRWIGRSLGSLQRSAFPVDIIVVDNASEDGTPDNVASVCPRAMLVRRSTNGGFGTAAQQGIDAALSLGAQAVLLMHHDVWVAPDAVGVLAAACTDDSLLVPVYMNGPGSGCETSFRKGPLRRSRKLRRTLGSGVPCKIKVSSVPGACWFLPSSLIRRIGPLNTMVPKTGESLDYLARMRYHRRSIYVVTGARVYHDRDSYGNRTLYDRSRVYRDLLLIGCDPRKGRVRRAMAYTRVLTGLVWKSAHYRINLLTLFRSDYRRTKKLRPLLRERRDSYRSSGRL